MFLPMYDQALLLYLSKLKASNCVPCKRSLFYLKDQHHGTICDYSVENLLCSYFKIKNNKNIINIVQGIQFEIDKFSWYDVQYTKSWLFNSRLTYFACMM